MFTLSRLRMRLSLRSQLIVTILLLFVLTAFLNYWLTNRIEGAALEEVQTHVETLSKAIEISLQQFPVERTSAQDVLRDYQSRLKSTGVTEITLLDPERRVIASTLVHAEVGEPSRTVLESSDELSGYDVTIPLVARESLLGYVHLHLVLDNFL